MFPDGVFFDTGLEMRQNQPEEVKAINPRILRQHAYVPQREPWMRQLQVYPRRVNDDRCLLLLGIF